MTDSVSPALARRVALAAQGFGRARPARVDRGHLRRLFGRIELLQIDSVNAFERSHYLPVLARLGPYDRAALDAMTSTPRSGIVEYWAHEAAFLPVESWPLFDWRRRAARDRALADPDGWASSNAAFLDWLRAELGRVGPSPARRIEHDRNVRTGPWWGWSDVKRGLETLFAWGEVVSAGRAGFERVYAPAEGMIPAAQLEAAPSRSDAMRELARRAARASGIGTTGDIADYFRTPRTETAAALAELAEAGEVERVSVPGWERSGRQIPAWLHADARRPRRLAADALLSPFDPVVWERERALRLFDFHYRIEIYTPAARRRYGYYVLPVLLGDRVSARVDLKHDRAARTLIAHGAWSEPGAPPDAAARIAALLIEAASWQGAERVMVGDRGDLAAAVAAEVSAAR